MGVLHMTVPSHGLLPRRSPARPGSPSRKLLRETPPADLRSNHPLAPPGGMFLSSLLPPPRGTLLPTSQPAGSRSAGDQPAEVKLQRTPEQEAAQEAAARLVRQCLAGDPQAWQQLVVSQHRRIYAICYRFTGSACDSEDLTQDVFLKLYKNLTSFDTQKGSFQTWITTLARNLLVDHFRRTRQERVTDSIDASFDGAEDGVTLADRLADGGKSQEQHVSGLELKVEIQAALKQLSPELREAVILRDLEDMDYKEIAEVLRIPEGTVKSRISRGRGELAKLLQRIEGQVM